MPEFQQNVCLTDFVLKLHFHDDQFQIIEKCPVLFKPELLGHDLKYDKTGIVGCVHGSLSKCAIDQKRTFQKNIILTGGTSKLQGLGPRFQLELEKLGARGPTFKIPELSIQLGEPMLSWTGGALLASSSNYDEMAMTRQEYDEFGYRHLKKKFLTGEQT